MFISLIVVIYLSFISLGLPDSLLGSAWPLMQSSMDVPLAYAGIISMIIAAGTIISSLMTDKLIRKFNTGFITAVSVLMTAVALFGFSVSNSFILLCLFAIPYGLGAGAVDAAINNYVALHYSSRHMSWLHAFWGVGVSVGPYILTLCLNRGLSWQSGYFSVGALQTLLVVLLFLSLGKWKRNTSIEQAEQIGEKITFSSALRIKGVTFILIGFFCFCALESTAGLWATSYMVNFRGMNAYSAAKFGAYFYLGETVGRFLNGFVADKYGDRKMIRIGIIVMLLGTLLIALPTGSDVFAFAGLVTVGFGAAPVYPCIIHSTPINFGKEHSQILISIQMASAYVGNVCMPPLFGVIAQNLSIGYYPLYLGLLAVIMLVMTETLNKKVEIKKLC